ncbi:MAG: alpha/beta fold hydrolase [Chthoniobacterales bacterium]
MRRPLLLFAPGAGAPSSHPWMQRWKRQLQEIGDVESFDYDYQREGRRRPDRLPQLIAAHRAALAVARERAALGTPVFLIGKSMGGRIGCHLALEEQVNGVVCLGYPLCAMGDRAKLRDQVLLSLGRPVLFVQGTRDPLCPLDLLEPLRSRMTAISTVHVVEGGDHSLGATKAQLRAAQETQTEVEERIAAAISDFVRRNSA